MTPQVDIHEVLAALDDTQQHLVDLISAEMKETASLLTEAVRARLPVKTGAWKASIRPTSRVVAAERAAYRAGVRWRTVVYAGLEEFGGTIPNRYTHGKGAPRHVHKTPNPSGYYVYPERDRQLEVLSERANDRVYVALSEAGFEVQKYTSG